MKKNNEKMLILSCIGIIIVVLGHTGGGIKLFDTLFPYYSFHMALFIFISGYFYKISNENNLLKKDGYILKKIKRLLIPYFLWNLIYGIICMIIRNMGIISYGEKISFKSLFLDPWIYGSQFHLNIASWFMLALFLVNITYVLLRKIFKSIWNDNLFLIFSFVLALISIYFSKTNSNNLLFILYRTMFFMFFYQFGYIYKLKIENKIKINNCLYLLILICVQIIMIKIDSKISYYAIFMNFNSKYIITPIIASLTGILFWTKISEILVPSLKDSKIVNYIGNNTYDIMLHHLFWLVMLNTFIYLISTKINLAGFDVEKYKSTIYYIYYCGIFQTCILYSIFCIAMPLLIKRISEKISMKCFSHSKKKTQL